MMQQPAILHDGVRAGAFTPQPGTSFTHEAPASIDAGMHGLESAGSLFGHWKRRVQAARRTTIPSREPSTPPSQGGPA